MKEVADLMVQEGMGFSLACQSLGKKFDNSQAERAAQYSEAFQNILNALNYRYSASIVDNPLFTKEVIVGTLMRAVRRLEEAQQWDKVAIPAKLVLDAMGWNEHDQDRPVLLNLTQRDIDELKAKFAEKQAQEKADSNPKLN
jgi:hypothetical protein